MQEPGLLADRVEIGVDDFALQVTAVEVDPESVPVLAVLATERTVEGGQPSHTAMFVGGTITLSMIHISVPICRQFSR
jgi:hypothetical protein